MLEFVADFETTARRVYDVKTRKLRRDLSETWVCAWALIPVEEDPRPEDIIHGRTVDSFMAAVAEIYEGQPQTGRKRRRHPQMKGPSC